MGGGGVLADPTHRRRSAGGGESEAPTKPAEEVSGSRMVAFNVTHTQDYRMTKHHLCGFFKARRIAYASYLEGLFKSLKCIC
jgi:hypothetical protein